MEESSMSIREHLESIKKKRGVLTPAYVLDEARDKNHPLHHRFEWDNSVAGEEYRRIQARELIQQVGVTYTKQNGSQGRMRGYYAIQVEGAIQYESTEEITKNPITREILLSSMKRDWEDLESRYHDLEEFWELVSEKVSVTK